MAHYASQIVGYVSLAAIVLAIWYARKRGKAAALASYAAAVAVGRASLAAELQAAASASVDVGGVHLHVGDGHHVDGARERPGSIGGVRYDRNGGYYDDDGGGFGSASVRAAEPGVLQPARRHDGDTDRSGMPGAARRGSEPILGDVGALAPGGARKRVALPRRDPQAWDVTGVDGE